MQKFTLFSVKLWHFNGNVALDVGNLPIDTISWSRTLFYCEVEKL